MVRGIDDVWMEREWVEGNRKRERERIAAKFGKAVTMARKLRTLARQMRRMGAEMEYIGGLLDGQLTAKAKQLMGASRMVDTWADGMVNKEDGR